MRKPATLFFIAVISLLLFSGTIAPTHIQATSSGSAPAAPAVAACWSVVPSSNIGTSHNYLEGVAALPPSDVWAVGYYYNSSFYQTLTEHWDGSSWSVVPSPNVGTSHNFLDGVTAISSNDVWAIGEYNGSVYQTLTEHWNGSSWSVVPSPNVGTSHNYLYGVTAISPSDVWAVGDYYYPYAGVYQTLTEHWDGSNWSVVPSPNQSNANYLAGVAATSPSDVWAVGNSGYNTLTEHWDGSSWSVVPSPNVGTNANYLAGVAAISPGDVWAVGDHGGSPYQTLTEHYSASVCPTPTPTYTPYPPTCGPDVCGFFPHLEVVSVTTSTINLYAWVNYSSGFTHGTYSFNRSTDGSHFTLIGSVSSGLDASYTDTNLNCGTSYYYYVNVHDDQGHYNADSNVVHTATASCGTLTPTPIPTGTSTRTPIPTSTPTVTGTPPTATPTFTPQPTVCPNPFVDIETNIFFHAINYLYCHGVISGTDASHYSPAGTATRAQFAKIVVLGFGTPFYTPTSGQDFTDVPPNYYAYVYIESGYHAGILSGFDQPGCIAHGAQYPCYLPNLPITRGQLTKLVVNAAHYPPYTPANGQTFSDVPPSNVFYVSIETAHYKGVINGYPDGSFHPNDNIRRDEMAQIVYKGVTTP